MNQSELNATIGTMTQILNQLDAGDPSAEEMVYRMQYGNLRRLASQVLEEAGRGNSVTTTGMVGQEQVEFGDTEQFIGIVRKRMRQIVYDYARSRTAKKASSDEKSVSMEDILSDLRHNGLATADAEPQRILSLQQLLEKLEEKNERDSDLIDLYYFVGLSLADIAARYALPEDAIRQRLQYVRAWLTVQDKKLHESRGSV